MLIETRTVVAFVSSRWEWARMGGGHEKTFWGNRNILYLDWGDSYIDGHSLYIRYLRSVLILLSC